jgi:hypothetical protein
MRILKVKDRSIDYNGNGTKNLRYVMAQRFKKNGYTHVQLLGIVYPVLIISGIVWIDDRDQQKKHYAQHISK